MSKREYAVGADNEHNERCFGIFRADASQGKHKYSLACAVMLTCPKDRRIRKVLPGYSRVVTCC